jgi:hypothetical protein
MRVLIHQNRNAQDVTYGVAARLDMLCSMACRDCLQTGVQGETNKPPIAIKDRWWSSAASANTVVARSNGVL